MNATEMLSLPRKKNVSLTLTQRKSVIEESEAGESARKLGRKYNVNPKVISRILKNKNRILEEFEESPNPNRKRSFKSTLNDELNTEVYEFYLTCRSQNIPVTGPMLQRHARMIAEKLNVLNFAASNGWLHKFKTRYNVSFQFSKEPKAETGSGQPTNRFQARLDTELKVDESLQELEDEDDNQLESEALDNYYSDIIEEPEYDFEEDRPANSEVDSKSTLVQGYSLDDLPTNVICGACLNIRPTRIKMTLLQRESFHKISDYIPLTDFVCHSCFEFLSEYTKFQKMVRKQHRLMQNTETKFFERQPAASHVHCPLTGHQVYIKEEDPPSSYEEDPCPSVYSLYPEIVASESAETQMETEGSYQTPTAKNSRRSLKLKPIPKLRYCDVCGFSNNSKSVVMSHIKRVHLKIHRRICSICNQKYFDLKNYKRHLELHHPNGEDNGLRINSETNFYDCEKCGASYRTMRSMIKHSCEKGRLQQRCPECNWPCASREGILNHIEKEHGHLKVA